MHTRSQLAELWRDAAKLPRQEIFCDADPLRPCYQDNSSPLVAQIDIPRVGMVGPHYDGRLVILSVSPSGGRPNAKPQPLSELMYEAIKRLRDAVPGMATLEAFEEQNRAAKGAMQEWAGTGSGSVRLGGYIPQILEASGCAYEDISNLTIVPFRTRDNKCTKMAKRYLDEGYKRLLVLQLRALEPACIVALDQRSKTYADRYEKEERPQVKVVYPTGGWAAEGEREHALAELAHVCSPPLRSR